MIVGDGSVQGKELHSVTHVSPFQFSRFCDPVIKSHFHLFSPTVGLDSLPCRLQSPPGLRESACFSAL